jgi:hypothetical protein
MARFEMDDGTIVDTQNAKKSWEEETDWNGNNHISRATGSQWDHEKLYKSAKGRYYIVESSQWQGSTDSANFVSDQEAATWLLKMEKELPKDLEKYEEEVCE